MGICSEFVSCDNVCVVIYVFVTRYSFINITYHSENDTVFSHYHQSFIFIVFDLVLGEYLTTNSSISKILWEIKHVILQKELLVSKV